MLFIKNNSNSVYRVRHTTNYLRHLCEELIYGVKVGRANITYNFEAYEELKRYREYTSKVSLNKNRTDLDLALERIVNVFICFIEEKGIGDLSSALSLAEIPIVNSRNLCLFEWQDMKDSETIYIKRKNSFLYSSNSKVRFKYGNR